MASNKCTASEEHDLTVKAVLIGDLGVGKTTFLQTLIAGKFTPSNYVNNLECKQKDVLYGNKQIHLKLWDTAGQEKYRSLTASYYRGVQGCIIFFDVTNAQTFDSVSRWIGEVFGYISETDVVIVLVGTKCHKTGREVSRDRATEFAENQGVPYLEISAERDIDSVNSVCDKLVELVLEKTERIRAVSCHEDRRLTRHRTWKQSCIGWCSC